LSRIRNEINRIFEDPFGFVTPGASFFEGWEPAVDIFEDHDRIFVRAELPGMKREDISVSLEGSTLTIAGERKHEEDRKDGDTYRSERYFGRFQRTITLPHAVNAEKIEANYTDGILSVTLPKSEESRLKKIEVKTT